MPEVKNRESLLVQFEVGADNPLPQMSQSSSWQSFAAPITSVMSHIITVIMWASVLPLFSLPAFGQIPAIPEPVFPEPPQPLPEEPLPPLEDLLESPPDTPTPQTQPPDIPGTIVVEQFEIVGSTVFSQTELAELLQEYVNRPITFAELLEVQQVITDYYRDRGYITSGAYIPPQTLQGGVVRVEVIEGRLEDIRVLGLEHLNPGYVRSRIGVATQPPLQQESLLNALQLLQLNPLIERLNAELSAGSQPGLSILTLQLEEANPWEASLSFDNQRSPSIGSFRRKLEVANNNVLGLGDRLYFSFSNTDGSNGIDTLSYTVPINPYNGTLSFAYRHSLSRIIEERFEILDIKTRTSSYELTLRQPFLQTPQEEFAIGLTMSRQNSRSELGIFNIAGFPLSAGADADGETISTVLRFFQEYTTRSDRDVFAARSQFNFGVDWLNATVNSEPDPDSNYFGWRGQVQYLRLLAPDTILLLRSDLQVSDRALLPLEQFSAGGALSVRGYRQDFLLADSGLFLSAETRIPVLRIPDWDLLLQVAPFMDFATVWSNGASTIALEDPTISSVGLGFLLRIGRNFNARLDWGIPLVEVNVEKDTWQENGLYFSVQYNFF
jgi:hemolysin activation/secretion protein